LTCAGGEVVHKAAARTKHKRGGLIVQLVVTRVQVIANAELQRQARRDLPIVLEVTTELQVPPVADIGLEVRVRSRTADEIRIDTGGHAIRLVGSKEERIKEVVRRTADVELRVLDVPPDISTELDVVLPFGPTDHVR